MPQKKLENALGSYLFKEIQRKRKPAFLSRKSNALNRFPQTVRYFATKSRAPQSAPPHPDLWLARVLDLNGLVPVFLVARRSRLAPFHDFPFCPGRRSPRSSGTSKATLEWLDNHLLNCSLDQQKTFIASVLEAIELNRGRKTGAYQPSWATFWARFKLIVNGDPELWASAVGLPNRRACARWLIVLKYRLRETGGLVRPTILDAGFNAYHFPSPPQASLRDGGYTMNLQLSSEPSLLVPEFIHQQIPHPFQHWRDANFLLGRTYSPRCGWLARRRRKHHELLRATYGACVDTWMPRCI